MHISILGERVMSKDNFNLGEFTLKNITIAPAGVPEFDIEFDIDADGTLTVTAKEKAKEITKSLKIDGAVFGELSTEEIKACIEKAERMELEDTQEEMRAIARGNLESFCFKMELEKTEPEELQKIRYKMNEL